MARFTQEQKDAVVNLVNDGASKADIHRTLRGAGLGEPEATLAAELFVSVRSKRDGNPGVAEIRAIPEGMVAKGREFAAKLRTMANEVDALINGVADNDVDEDEVSAEVDALAEAIYTRDVVKAAEGIAAYSRQANAAQKAVLAAAVEVATEISNS